MEAWHMANESFIIFYHCSVNHESKHKRDSVVSSSRCKDSHAFKTMIFQQFLMSQ